MNEERKILSVRAGERFGDATAPATPPSQFVFVAAHPFLHEHAAMAEALAIADPRGSAMRSRLGVEAMVRWLYDHDASLRVPYETSLNALTNEPSFRRLVGLMVGTKIDLIRKIGNRAAHPGAFGDSQAISAVRELFHVCYWFASHYSQQPPPPELGFSADLLPRNTIAAPTDAAAAAALQAEAARHAEALERERAERLRDAEGRAAIEAELERLKAEYTALRQANSQADARHDYNEAQTRDEFIDLLLREAGWALTRPGRDTEFEVTGMPNSEGRGFADYVLWGADGKPLGVVEAKRTRKDPREGKQQAKLYADCLENMFGQRPVIFYTNGYDHHIWDDKRYPPRPISGFLTRDELELVVQRRSNRLPLATVPTNRDIAAGGGRNYQEKAIRAVTHRIEDHDRGGEHQRKALLVMATGSGKTRTVIALSDILMRANWVKRVLFLADRVPLVRQAANAFKKHLPDCATVNVCLEPANDGRVFVSTYPTMMNLIERSRADGRQRFGPGYFDLIVIDEAHRSVYRKYRAIFDWFDAPLVGLTATPKDEVDRNTYQLFELEQGVPTDAYDLKQAVADEWLVPPRARDVPMKFPREGIKYDDLSDEEKDEWDATEWGEDGPPDSVDPSAVNDWLFNQDTIDKMLEQLMRDGLKVDEGEKLGKTIIFAKNHRHAEFIVERFDANYPHLKGQFCQLIDNQVRYAHQLIDRFSDPSDTPQIAVSVDMLDTGIDIPEILNLVFFKIVRSKSKFWQMIGRGTRLCPGIFGEEKGDEGAKRFFYVFDYLGNFDFFNAQIPQADGKLAMPLGERLFRARVKLLGLLQPREHGGPIVKEEPEAFEGAELGLYRSVRDHLAAEVAGMPLENFIVRSQRRYVEKFQRSETWQRLSQEDQHELAEYLSGLPTSVIDNDVDAKRFDMLCLRVQLSLLRGEPVERLRRQWVQLVHALEAKESIPDVAKLMVLIQEVQTDDWWRDLTPEMIEQARRKLRGLMSLIEPGERVIVTTNFTDEIGDTREIAIGDLGDSEALAQFRRKARAYIEAHRDHLTLERLRQGRPLTQADLDELQRMFEHAGVAGANDFARFRAHDGLPALIRSWVGLDRNAAKRTLNDALDGSVLSAQQLHFLDLIIDHLTSAGSMDPALLYEPPYTDEAPNGVSDVFDLTQVQNLVSAIRGLEPRYAEKA
ncbi:DEAD/DEAH box helicase family protein [Sphingomonas kaistensis]|uniref:DEAD/DEAH box helicase family protein n=1 Tax=Sphingomonas kaistensis TaxID=298708 RepID=A0ABZ2FX67_9SPHN